LSETWRRIEEKSGIGMLDRKFSEDLTGIQSSENLTGIQFSEDLIGIRFSVVTISSHASRQIQLRGLTRNTLKVHHFALSERYE
jgi:hypothetical protein